MNKWVNWAEDRHEDYKANHSDAISIVPTSSLDTDRRKQGSEPSPYSTPPEKQVDAAYFRKAHEDNTVLPLANGNNHTNSTPPLTTAPVYLFIHYQNIKVLQSLTRQVRTTRCLPLRMEIIRPTPTLLLTTTSVQLVRTLVGLRFMRRPIRKQGLTLLSQCQKILTIYLSSSRK
jgi:hypothetical protein